MLVDPFGRSINYLRISVTDRCNLRCEYCMPASGVKLLDHAAILSFEEITEVARIAVGLGCSKLRITGGEPLVRLQLEVLVGMLAAIPGVDDLSMTTNGVLLPEMAPALAMAGLCRVNISLDTLDSTRYREITRGGDVRQVLAGIDAARQAGLTPIKLNCVVRESSTEPDAQALASFAQDQGLEIRFIKRMVFSTGTFSLVEGGEGGHCACCSRLRLSSDGYIRPCLFSDLAFSVRELGAARALAEAVRCKPEAGGPCTHDWIHGIGG